MVTFANPQGAYRQSLIATFDSCPLRAKFALEDRRRTPSPLAARGTLFHRFVHRAAQYMWANGERSMPVEVAMEFLLGVLAQHDVASEEVVPLTMKEMRWIRVLVTKWCENVSLDPRRVLAAEKRFYADLPLPIEETVPITGQLDLLLADPPDGLIIIDYKSGYARPKDVRNEEKSEREGGGLTELGWAQNLIYCYLLFENFPTVNRVLFREHHVLWGKERRARTERWEMERLKDVLVARVTQLHLAMREGPESARWFASAGAHCAWCANPRDCPIIEDEQIDLSTERGRQLVAQEWIVATEVRKHRRKILDGLVEAYGPIEVPHAEGRRFVGWEIDGTRNFKILEAHSPPESAYDDGLAQALREAKVLVED